MRWVTACALVCTVVPLVAHAQPVDVQREFQLGVDAFRLGKLDEAKAHLVKAVSMDPKLPGPHRFLAAVAKSSTKWQDCLDESRIAIQLNPTSSEIGDTRKLYDECRAGAGRAPYKGELGESAAIAVTTNVPGATVKIGGLTYGGTPLAPRPITAGTLEIDIEKLGWKPSHQKVDAIAGIVTDVIVDLEPDPNAQTKPDLGTGPKPTMGFIDVPAADTATLDGKSITAGKLEQEPGTYTIELRTSGNDPWRRRVRVVAGQTNHLAPTYTNTDTREGKQWLGMALIGGSLGAAAVGFGAVLASHDAAYEARDIERKRASGDVDRSKLDAAIDRADKWSVVSNVAFGVSIFAIIGGSIAMYAGAGDRTDVPASYALVPTHGGAIVGKTVTW